MSKSRILELIDRHTPDEGAVETGVEGLRLFRVSQPIKRIPTVYSPVVCGVLQGSKHGYLNGREHVYDERGFLCCTIPLPIESEIIDATPEKPVLGFLLSLESKILTETLLELDPVTLQKQLPGITIVDWDASFTDATCRLLGLLDDPEALRILGEGRLREVLFALAAGEAGAILHRNSGALRDISRVLRFIQSHLHEPLTVDDLVKEARMSKTVLHRKFKAATTLSPFQFIKNLRLNYAAMMIAGGENITQSAYNVGYENYSQFNREFRRHFNRSPREWADTSRARSDIVRAAELVVRKHDGIKNWC